MMYYKDDIIAIRDIRESDITSLFSWWIDKEVNKHDPRPLPSNSQELLEECRNYSKRFEEEIINENEENRRYKYFIIVDKEDTPIGSINIFNFDNEKKDVELGVSIGDRRYWRKGIASKALEVITDYIFENMNIERIYIETSEKNIPALNLFTKLDFNRCDEYVEEGKYKFIVMEKRKDM